MPARIRDARASDTGSSATRKRGSTEIRPGDGDALELAARELVREAVEIGLDRGEPGARHGADHALALRCRVAGEVDARTGSRTLSSTV